MSRQQLSDLLLKRRTVSINHYALRDQPSVFLGPPLLPRQPEPVEVQLALRLRIGYQLSVFLSPHFYDY